MKKKISLLLAAVMAVFAVTACGSTGQNTSQTAAQSESVSQTETESETGAETKDYGTPVDVNIMALKGPTAMGMVKMMDDVDNGNLTDENYQFTIAASADEVTPKLVQGEADIAAVPANLASVLYNNTDGGVKVLAINTLGVLYIVENAIRFIRWKI